VPAFGELVVDELGIRALDPRPRGSINVIWKGADGYRNGDVLGGKEGQLVFPLQTSRRHCRVRQPIERDVVEDVVSRQALRLTVEDTRDELIAAYVMVNYPGGQADR
jgi:hypothetical protein